MKTRYNWKQFLFEFLCIFIAVILAFILTRWNENHKDRLSESKILSEIQHGLQRDLDDFHDNIGGHEQGIKACFYFRDLIKGDSVNRDSASIYYRLLFRDFISIQNQSGYESLKSKGLELIENDSLRLGIISLYDFNYQIIQKLEEDYSEMQFNKTYFSNFNEIIAPYLVFSSEGNLTAIESLVGLSETDKKKLLSYLMRIESNRRYTLRYYDEVEITVNELIEDIKKELK